MKNKGLLSLILFVFVTAPVWLSGSGETPLPRQERSLRIVTCGRAHSLILDALYMFPEASQALVAHGNTSQIGGSFIAVLDPEADRRALLAMEVGAEEVLAHDPDYVVLKSYLKSGLGSQLEDLGVAVLYVDLESPDQFQRDITAIGKMLGNPERAELLNRYFAENLLQVQKISAGISGSRKPDTLLLYYGARSGTASFNVPPKEWLQTSIVQWAGGKPVWLEAAAASGWQQVGFEQIAAWNPEYILLVSYHTPVDEVKRNLLADPKWSQLWAVRQGKLLAFPTDYLSWDQPDPRWILGLHWLVGKLHPELGDANGIEAKVIEFYNFVYGLSPKQVKETIVPIIRGDFP